MTTKTITIATAAAALAACAANADLVLSSYDFNSFTPGQLATAANGTTAGEGGWYTYTTSSTNGAGNFNIVADPATGGTHGNVYGITGGTTQIGNNGDRSSWTNDVHNTIGNRAPGENLVVANFEMFVGGAATSKNRLGALLYDATGTKVLSGLYMQANTRQLFIAAYSGSTPANNVTSLGSTAVLALNTWYSFTCTFDMVSGRAQVGFLNQSTGLWTMFTVDGAAAGTTVDRFTLSSLVNQSSNTSSGFSYSYYDNINVYATPAPGAVALLGLAGLLGSARRRK